MRRSVTIRDVAKAAGVSPSTVSRTFVRPEKVETVTRERVLMVAAELDYRPNAAARSLITGQTGNIGVVVPDLSNPFFPSVVRGIQQTADALGYSILLVDTGEDVEREPELVARLARQVDGLVLCSPRMSPESLQHLSNEHQLVIINRQVPGVPAITIDNASGIAEEVAHLKALGHHRIGYVAGPESSYSCLERQRAAREHLAAAGLEEINIGRFEPSFDGGRKAAAKAMLSDATAIMVYNDVIAMGLITRLTEYGVRIPDELTVVGFDDIEFSEMLTPALSTVHVPRRKSGTLAMEYLHARLTMTDSEPEIPPLLPTEFIYRASTKRLVPEAEADAS